MSQTAEILGASRSSYVRVVGAVSAAHFVSHYYIILLAPLLPFVRADYGVSYTEIGFAFAAFNVVSAALQTLAGFGNTVHHPAGYAILSHRVPSDRIGQAFSVHTFAGMLGSAVAPVSLLM